MYSNDTASEESTETGRPLAAEEEESVNANNAFHQAERDEFMIHPNDR